MMITDTTVLLILKLLGITFPVLRSWSFILDRSTVVINDNETQKFIRKLSNYKLNIFSSADREEDIIDSLTKQYSELVIYIYNGSAKSKEHVALIETGIKSGMLRGKPLLSVPIIISNGLLPSDLIRNPFYIELDELQKKYEVKVCSLIEEYLPEDKELEVVKNEVEERCKNQTGRIEMTIMAAICFLYPQMKSKGNIELYELLHREAKSIVVRANQLVDSDGIKDCFIAALEMWKRKTSSFMLCELPYLAPQSEKAFTKTVFYDTEYVYMHNNLFRIICRPLTTKLGINSLKRMLAEEGVIVCNLEKSSTFTSKMTVKGSDNLPKRYDMIKLKADELSRAGELDFISSLTEVQANEN